MFNWRLAILVFFTTWCGFNAAKGWKGNDVWDFALNALLTFFGCYLIIGEHYGNAFQSREDSENQKEN